MALTITSKEAETFIAFMIEDLSLDYRSGADIATLAKAYGDKLGRLRSALEEAQRRAERAEALNGRLVDALCAFGSATNNRHAGPG